MEVQDLISNTCHQKNRVWCLDGHSEFDYSDGNVQEEYIREVILKAKDLSHNSRELETHIRDWSSRYHLSRNRSAAYWPLVITKEMTILEIGSGCGSITRYLAEKAGSVVALEGSRRRAEITSARVRDLTNVTVICAPFGEVDFKFEFDLVVLNGVLEYACHFVDHEEPHGQMVSQCKGLLKPAGTLCVAIENQFGLKYFNSSKEDHTGGMYDGIEGYSKYPFKARTFGYQKLKEILGAHFEAVEFFFPLPDYKFPGALVSEKFLASASCAELFAVKTKHDCPDSRRPSFHEGLAWHEAEKNGLLPHMANSFFVLSSNSPQELLNENWLASIYAIHRAPQYTTNSSIHEAQTGEIVVRKEKLEIDEPSSSEDSRLGHDLHESLWINEDSLHTLIARKMCEHSNDPLETRLKSLVLAWWESVSGDYGSDSNLLPPDAIDLNWRNSLYKNGEVSFIDKEWKWNDGVGAEWLIVRTVTSFLKEEIHYVHRWSPKLRNITGWRLMKVVAEICGRKITLQRYLSVLASDKELQRITCGGFENSGKLVLYSLVPMQIRQHLVYLRKAFNEWLQKVKLKLVQKFRAQRRQ